MPSLDIIIVNWNAGLQLRDCLKSIEAVNQEGFRLNRVVVVDNASSDNSLEGLDSLSLPFTTILNMENRGFGAACNQGAALCNASYLLFLNPDTRLFNDSLSVPLAFMEDKANQNIGICGIQLVDEQGYVTRSCARFPSLSRFAAQIIGLNKISALRGKGMNMAEWDHMLDKTVDQVIGAFFFMRAPLFEVLNGFDERFFVYFEEVDVSLRAKQMGWNTVYLAGVQAFHKGGGTSQQVKTMRLFYSIRSRLMYAFKHFPLWKAWMLLGMSMFVEPITRVLFCALKMQRQGIVDTLRGYRMLWSSLADIISSRY